MRDAISYIHSFHTFGKAPGLHRISQLLRLLDDPQKQLRCIHVAGTNGKGSICCYISNILCCAGLKTGLFTSPYVLDFRERFQICGKMISEPELENLVNRIRPVVNRMPEADKPTQFDLITAIAFLFFKENKCDAVVLETGLGGLYDSTNVIAQPLCTVITSISRDHTAVLGKTIAEITAQKAGIIKPGCDTVLYPLQEPAAERILRQTALRQNSQLILPDKQALAVTDLGLHGSRVQYGGLNVTLRMCGAFQPLNAITAVEAVRCSGLHISSGAIAAGLEQAVLPARCEVLRTAPPLLLDGAHNPDGMRVLADFIRQHFPRPTVAVMGVMADKEVAAALEIIAPCFTQIFCVTPDNPRALVAEELAKLGAAYTKCTSCNTVAEALAYTQDLPTVICGSLFLAAEARKYMQPRI